MKRFYQKIWALLTVMLLAAALFSGCAPETSAAAAGLIISEVVSSNASSLADPVYGAADWIELYNNSSAPISLKGYGLSTSKNDPYAYTFPDVTLGAGEYLIVFCCKTPKELQGDALCTGFNLSKKGVNLFLSYPGNTILSMVEIPQLETDISYGWNGREYVYYLLPTPGAANGGKSASTLEALKQQITQGLRINEVCPSPIGEGSRAAWVELYNAGEQSVQLSDFCITEDAGNLSKAHLPQQELQPGEYIVLELNGTEESIPFKIGADEHMLILSDGLGSVVDSIEWESGIFAGVSVGVSDTGVVVYYKTPTPGEKNGGEQLENASFALQEGLPDVYINEYLKQNKYSLTDSDGERQPWAELYNASQREITLSDYYLSDDAQDAWKWRLPAVTLKPGEYLIVFLSGKDQTQEELHASFRLGSSDTHLTLTSLTGGLRQVITLPSQYSDNVSCGRNASGEWKYFPQPTPGGANTTAGFATLAAAGAAGISAPLRINEVVSVVTARSEEKEWVELYNSSSSVLSLNGYYLSDSSKNLKKWRLGNVSVEAGGYAVIKEAVNGTAKEELRLSASGETLFLSSPDGVLLDSFTFSALRPGLSCGRTETGKLICTTPTPGRKNSESGYAGYCSQPVFSVQGGYCSDTFTLEMRAAVPGAEIYYTTDGSTPTENSKRYSEPVAVSKTTVIRAIAVSSSALQSEETVATYFFGERHTLPVVSLSMTKSDLNYVFASESRLDIRERAGYAQYYEADGTLGVSFPAGFRITGNGTRRYAQKSINLYLRGAYGRSGVTYPFFEDYGIHDFKSVSLRNMGQDWGSTRLRDAFCMMAVKNLNLDTMQTRFAVVYINGQYWGLYEFKENQNEDYLAAKYGIDPDKVELIRNNTTAYKGTNEQIKKLYEIAKSGDMNDPETFKKLTDIADEAYFMDYLIATVYFTNSDAYNQKYAHTNDNSLKWRPLFFDLDWSHMYNNPRRSILAAYLNPDGIPIGKPDANGNRTKMNTSVYCALMANDGWRERFIERCAYLMNNDFSDETLLALYDSMVEQISGEMPRTVERWHQPASMQAWEENVSKLRDTLAARRAYFKETLRTTFHLSDARMAELFPNG